MRIRQKLQYHKQRDAFIDDVDMGAELEHLVESSQSECLENSVLCFLLCGLHGRYKIPVGYYFIKGCTGQHLAEVTRHVIQKTSQIGFDVVRAVTNNQKINVAAVEVLCDGELEIHVPHPADATKNIFLAFRRSESHNQKYQITVSGKGHRWTKRNIVLSASQCFRHQTAVLQIMASQRTKIAAACSTRHRNLSKFLLDCGDLRIVCSRKGGQSISLLKYACKGR